MKKTAQYMTSALSAALMLITSSVANLAAAEQAKPISSNQKIRFYKVNKDMQGDRIMLTSKKSAQTGCHNFIKKVRVHRVVQTGYIACSLYEDKNCAIESIVPVATEKEPRRTYLLSEGFGWLPQSEEERGVVLKSWQCDMEPEVELLGRDSELAKKEVPRLQIIAARAKEIAERAKKKAEKAEKISIESVEAAEAALKRAVDAGYEPPPQLTESIGENDFDEEENTDENDKEKSEPSDDNETL